MLNTNHYLKFALLTALFFELPIQLILSFHFHLSWRDIITVYHYTWLRLWGTLIWGRSIRAHVDPRTFHPLTDPKSERNFRTGWQCTCTCNRGVRVIWQNNMKFTVQNAIHFIGWQTVFIIKISNILSQLWIHYYIYEFNYQFATLLINATLPP